MSDAFGLSEKICDAESKCLSCGAPLPVGREEQRKFTGGRTSIVVLGDDGDDTKVLLDNSKTAISKFKSDMEITLVVDENIVSGYNIRKLPALVINGSIVSQGLVSDVESIIEDIEFLGL